MKKYPLIGVSIVVACVIVLSSFTNVIGVQTVKTTNHSIVNGEVDQKELLFQTILDIANNKEIQRIILNSEMRQAGFFNPDIRFSVTTPHVLTKEYLNSAYNIGLMLSKTLGVPRMHSLLERHNLNNQGVQKEITAVIEKDATLNGEITQLSNSKCDCENDNTTRGGFPVLCTLLSFLYIFIFIMWGLSHFNHFWSMILGSLSYVVSILCL